jgi:hypothetical protein
MKVDRNNTFRNLHWYMAKPLIFLVRGLVLGEHEAISEIQVGNLYDDDIY